MAYFTLPPSGNAVPASFLLEAGDWDFAAAFAAHSGYHEDHILFTASGASALFVALRAFAALRPDRKTVAIPAWCCPSVPQSVIQAGLRPVLVDLDPVSLAYDPASLDAVRERGLLAVVLVHFLGARPERPAGDWGGTAFLRDCAQDFERHRDPEDDAPCFYSFGRGKALNAGHGGALCLSGEPEPLLEACRKALAELPASRHNPFPKALAINLFSKPRLFWALTRLPFLGIGATTWQDPLVLEAIAPGFPPLGSACLEAYLQRRDYYRKLVGKYHALLGECDGGRIVPPVTPRAGLPMRFPVMVEDRSLRDDLFQEANARFGGLTRMYPAILPNLPGAPALMGGDDFPGAKRIGEELLTLPVTAELMGREEGFVACLAEILARHGALRRPLGPSRPAADWTPVGPGRDG